MGESIILCPNLLQQMDLLQCPDARAQHVWENCLPSARAWTWCTWGSPPSAGAHACDLPSNLSYNSYKVLHVLDVLQKDGVAQLSQAACRVGTWQHLPTSAEWTPRTSKGAPSHTTLLAAQG